MFSIRTYSVRNTGRTRKKSIHSEIFRFWPDPEHATAYSECQLLKLLLASAYKNVTHSLDRSRSMSLKLGEGDALHSFGPVANANERFLMILGALKSDEAPLCNPYLDVFRFFIRKKYVAQKKINLKGIRHTRSDKL